MPNPTPFPPTPFSAPINAGSADANVPAVAGTSGQLLGNIFEAGSGTGVYGLSGSGAGVYGDSNTGSGVYGTSQNFDGVHGETQSNQHAGVSGINNSGPKAGQGGPGVYGFSSNLDGVQGWSQSVNNAGVSARNTAGGTGVWAQATGPTKSSGGIAGYFNSDGNVALQAINTADYDAILAQSSSAGHAAVAAHGTKYGVWASGATAGYFQGDVEVTGTLTVLGDITMPAADFAEDFPVQASVDVEPGTVMAFDENGMLRPSNRGYDRKVAGVISGAGDYRPGLILDREKFSEGRLPLALVGKVYCKADAIYGAIEVGDMLTTSPTPGHAMKASDPLLAFGAVIGKALKPLKSGQALVPILVALQ